LPGFIPLQPARALLPIAVAALLVPLPWPPAAAQPSTTERAAAEPPASPKPFPAIEAGMHTAIIRRIAVDRAGRWAVTTSEDKTARLWNLATGQLERVLRVPVGEGAEGKLLAVALSPDGALVALGGITNPEKTKQSIYLFDRASGRLLQRLSGLPSTVRDLVFAADGRRLAAALSGANGIRVYGAMGQGAWAQLAVDGEYGDGSSSVDFDAAGRLLATSYDGELRLYGDSGSGRLYPLVRRAAPGGRQPFSARFSPDAHRIAVGFNDSTAVAVLDGRSLEPLAPADTSSITYGDLSKVAWSADGRHLLAAGRYRQDDDSHPLVVWPADGGAPQRLSLGMTNTVVDLRTLADGRLVYAGADPAWGVLDPLLRRTAVFAGPPVLDLRGNPGPYIGKSTFKAFRLAADGRWLEFRAVSRSDMGPTARLVRFDLAQRRLLLPGGGTSEGVPPITNGLALQRRQGILLLSGRPITDKNNTIFGVAISSTGSSFAVGSDWGLLLFDASGRELWRSSTPGVAWMVNLSADGRFVVAALSDGTIRWYRTRAEGTAAAGSEALALFVHPDLKRWILWTPEGFYDASPGGAELFGYHLNNGRDQAGTFISSAQLQQKFFRPDLIARRLAGDEAAIAAAVVEVGDVRTSLSTATLPPRLRLLSQRTLPDGDLEITYELTDQGGGIGPVELKLECAVLAGRSDPPVGGINRRRLRPPAGKSRLQLLAYSRGGVASLPVGLDLTGTASSEPATLHLLAVGITNYRDGALRKGVRFAAGDALAFQESLTAAGRASTARVAPPVLLRDEQASGERIRQELTAMAQRVKPADLFVLYLAGHGVTSEQGEYVFLPQDLLYRNSESLAAGGLGGKELRALLTNISSTKTVVVLDTCSSGAFALSGRSLAEKGAIDRLSRLSGRVVLAAAGDERMALESPDNQRGIFTGALLRALAGAADSNRDGQVGVREVADYVEREVQRITQELFKYEQTPMSDLRGQNFPLSKTGGRP